MCVDVSLIFHVCPTTATFYLFLNVFSPRIKYVLSASLGY